MYIKSKDPFFSSFFNSAMAHMPYTDSSIFGRSEPPRYNFFWNSAYTLHWNLDSSILILVKKRGNYSVKLLITGPWPIHDSAPLVCRVSFIQSYVFGDFESNRPVDKSLFSFSFLLNSHSLLFFSFFFGFNKWFTVIVYIYTERCGFNTKTYYKLK